ncbi:MAG: hypothetical protein IH921_13785, partial [Gemmatimonadetes bacterium]|nr:hypothetical protein [Gemmatimonadota bacterium]
MTYSDSTGERCQRGFVEHLGDQPHVLVNGEGFAVGHCDPCALLATVLAGKKAKVGHAGRIRFRSRQCAGDAVQLGGKLP